MTRRTTRKEEPAGDSGGFFARLGLLVFSGGVLGAAFYLPDLSFLGFLLLAPLIVFAIRARSIALAALEGYVYGFAYLFVAHAWVIESYSARWTSLEFAGASASLAAVIVVTVGSSALLFAAFAALTRFVASTQGPAESIIKKGGSVLLLAAVFTALEYARLPLFALITLGPGGTDWFYTSGFLGYLSSGFPGLRLLAGAGDVYLLTFFLALVNAAVALAYLAGKGRQRMARYAAIVIVLALLNGGLTLLAPEKGGSAAVLGLATAVEGGMTEETREQAARDALLARANDISRADLVVFPETYGMSLVGAFGSGTPPVIASRRVARVSDAVFIGALFREGHASSYAEKRILVPYGEYVPYLARAVGTLADRQGTAALVASLNAIPGKKEGRVFDANGLRPGLLFCNEAWAPEAAARLREEGADMVVVVASHASFEHPALLEAFEERVLSIRAATLRMPLVQVTNRGRSYVVDASGEILSRYASGETFLAEVPLPVRP